MTNDIVIALKEAIQEIEARHKIKATITNMYDKRCIEIEIQSSPYVAINKIITQIKAQTAKNSKRSTKTSWIFSKVPSLWSSQALIVCSDDKKALSEKINFINSIPTSNRDKEKTKWKNFKKKLEESFNGN